MKSAVLVMAMPQVNNGKNGFNGVKMNPAGLDGKGQKI